VSMGIAATKTLAKVANRFAKKYKGYHNVCIIETEEQRIKALQNTKVEDVWGIGRGMGAKLNNMGVFTAYDFTRLSKATVRKHFTVVGERILRELHGEPCIDMELKTSGKKSICTSRAFGKMQTTYEGISEAVATFAAICAEKLRKQNSCAVALTVFIHTNRFREDMAQYAQSLEIHLPVASNSTLEIVKYALEALRTIFKEGYSYKKAGVVITQIVSDNVVQGDIFDTVDREKHARLMKVMDKLNHDAGFNSNTLFLGAQGTGRDWKLTHENLSPSYTTKLSDILTVNV
ncbi:MAG: DUF4113 domain-containing protein, partial [Prevotellaceae bacterium]|nr:DUF4113 domain-containing protein [Prevotellaceae bacterium]